MLQDYNSPYNQAVPAMTPAALIKKQEAFLKAQDVVSIQKLLLLVKASKGEIIITSEDKIPEGASEFIAKQLKEKADRLRERIIEECVAVALDLSSSAELLDRRFEEEIVSLQKQLRKLKKNKKLLNQAQKHGKETSNYLPLVALMIPRDTVEEAGIDEELLEIPKAPKVTKATKVIE